MPTFEGDFSPPAGRFAIVVARFNATVTESLLAGCRDALRRGTGSATTGSTSPGCPGSFEIPVVAQTLAGSGRYAAVICLGCVIRGETGHYDHVAGQAAAGVLQAGLATGVPVIFGVLTTETVEQALNRAGLKAGNKGADAALAAIEMVNLLEGPRTADGLGSTGTTEGATPGMTTPLLPQAFWFRLAVPCPRVDGLPAAGGEAAARPARVVPPAADGRCSTAGSPGPRSASAWNPDGLAVAVEAEGTLGALADDDRPDGALRRPGLGRHPRHPRRQPGDPVLPPVRRPADRGVGQDGPGRRGRASGRSPARSPTPRSAEPDADRRAGRAAQEGLAARAVPPRRGAPRVRPRDEPPARLRLPGHRPRPRRTSSSASAASSRSARTRASGRPWN